MHIARVHEVAGMVETSYAPLQDYFTHHKSRCYKHGNNKPVVNMDPSCRMLPWLNMTKRCSKLSQSDLQQVNMFNNLKHGIKLHVGSKLTCIM